MRALAACAVAAVSFHSLEAAACGCFASSNTTTVNPVIQAGERILFAKDGNTVTAYVQIKFQGDPQEFGWLVPVPAVPDVKAGTDEVFEVLDENTRPQFQLTTTTNSKCIPSSPIGIGCASRAVSLSDRTTGGDMPAGQGPLVLRDTAGPYDYAVLHADSKAAVQQWLQDNRYFVPVTSDAALAPYIRPGAYFLALKLRAGQTTGDLRPIVLKYTSDYAMIPLVLTSATAVPNMGVQVFVLGSARAIPRNYSHVVLNPLKLDWTTGENYAALVTAAVAEAPKKHAFVTEYAGKSVIAAGKLVPDQRFGDALVLSDSPTPEIFVDYLFTHGYAQLGVEDPRDLPESLLGILETQIPYPAGLTGVVDRKTFFQNLPLYLSTSTQQQHPEWYMGWPGVHFDAIALGAAVNDGYAQPIRDAANLISSHLYLTRLFTTLSPEDMTEDPTFGFSTTLPEVKATRTATRTTGCQNVPTVLETELYTLPDEAKLTNEKKAELPAAAKVETLQEEGDPLEVKTYVLDMSLSDISHGCAVADGAFFAGLAAVWLVMRRRKIQ